MVRRFVHFRYIAPLVFVLSIPVLLLLGNSSLNSCESYRLTPCFGPITALLIFYGIPGFYTFMVLYSYLGINLFVSDPLKHPIPYFIVTMLYIFILGVLADSLVGLIKSMFKKIRSAI